MEKNSINNHQHQHQHRNRERIGVLGQVGDHHDDGLLRTTTTTTTQTPETRSSDFVLQWGNRKRLRCMKIQVKVNNTTDSSSAAVPVHRTTVRVDRRVIRSDTNNNNNRETSSNHPSTTASNGYLNLRQRPPSPSHRILRNSESLIAMKGQSNGVKGVTSPDRGGAQDKMGSLLHNNSNNNITVATTTTTNNNNNKNSNDNGGRGGRGGGSGVWEGAQDSKKGGNSSGSDGMPVVWPPKFVIGLTNKEKEEDFFAFKGSKLPQRPKKRAKFIQRTLNLVSPGAWLCDLTLERYEVREKKISKKRPRGLRAMGNSMDSDSE